MRVQTWRTTSPFAGMSRIRFKRSATRTRTRRSRVEQAALSARLVGLPRGHAQDRACAASPSMRRGSAPTAGSNPRRISACVGGAERRRPRADTGHHQGETSSGMYRDWYAGRGERLGSGDHDDGDRHCPGGCRRGRWCAGPSLVGPSRRVASGFVARLILAAARPLAGCEKSCRQGTFAPVRGDAPAGC
jgi:hypothetical protein